jgi:hypothetical protein
MSFVACGTFGTPGVPFGEAQGRLSTAFGLRLTPLRMTGESVNPQHDSRVEGGAVKKEFSRLVDNRGCRSTNR